MQFRSKDVQGMNIENDHFRQLNKPARSTRSINWRAGTSLQIGTEASVSMNLEELKEAGIDWIELAWRHDVLNMLDPGNQALVSQLVRNATKIGLQIWTIHLPYGPEWDISAADSEQRERIVSRHMQLLELAAVWNIKNAVIHPSWEPIAQTERNMRISACKRSLAMLAEDAERKNIRIAVECLPRSCLGNTSGEMTELLNSDARLGVCCDVNHLLQEAPDHFIRALGSRIITVHMSDNDEIDEKHWLPGKGIIQWNQVMTALLDCGYKGPFMFEARPVTPAEIASCWNTLVNEYHYFQGEIV